MKLLEKQERPSISKFLATHGLQVVVDSKRERIIPTAQPLTSFEEGLLNQIHRHPVEPAQLSRKLNRTRSELNDTLATLRIKLGERAVVVITDEQNDRLTTWRWLVQRVAGQHIDQD